MSALLHCCLVAFCMVALFGCSSTGVSVAPLGAEVACSSQIASMDELSAGYEEIGGQLALPLQTTHELGRSGTLVDPDSAFQFAKFGLFIRDNADFQLHVGKESQGNALIHWGDIGERGPVGSLSVVGCPSEGQWNVYAGGVWVLRPSCVDLTFVSEQEVIVFQLSIGEVCA